MDEFGTEFPHGIGRVAKRELAANGSTRYDQLTTAAAKELLRIHGIGKKAVGILRSVQGDGHVLVIQHLGRAAGGLTRVI
jgi:predicted flap endonuclease-1-like 5' DNA nuclease